MDSIKCSFSDLSEVINDEYLPYTVYIDLEKSSLETYDIYDVVESDVLIRLPYGEELYSKNSALGDYIRLTGMVPPAGISARRYFQQNGLFPDFYGFYNQELALRLGKWFKEKNLSLSSMLSNFKRECHFLWCSLLKHQFTTFRYF